MRHYLITALVFLSALVSALDMSAQSMKVTGTVFDNEGQSLPGAYVIRYDASKANILESVMVDIDGKCGGYNLQWAWSSGAIAGINAGKKAKEVF